MSGGDGDGDGDGDGPASDWRSAGPPTSSRLAAARRLVVGVASLVVRAISRALGRPGRPEVGGPVGSPPLGVGFEHRLDDARLALRREFGLHRQAEMTIRMRFYVDWWVKSSSTRLTDHTSPLTVSSRMPSSLACINVAGKLMAILSRYFRLLSRAVVVGF